MEDGPIVTFKIRRKNLLADVLQKFKVLFGEKDYCKINVEFISFSKTESGVDTGGLAREMFSSLFNSAPGKLLQGPINRHTFLHDLARLEASDFYAFGQSVVLALLHNCEAPHQLCDGVVSYILGINLFEYCSS